MYTAHDIAHYIIIHEHECGRIISNPRLQKLLYFIQCNAIILLGGPIFSDTIKAWDFGPVVFPAYYYYRFYGSNSIPVPRGDYYPESGFFKDRAAMKFVNGTVDTAAKYSTKELTDIISRQSPWRDALHSYSQEITVTAIQLYFDQQKE